MLLLNDSNIPLIKMNDIILISLLSANDYVLLQIILKIRERVRKAKKMNTEPIITLQQNYIATLCKCSPNTLVTSIDRLCTLGIIERVSNNFGACAEYRFNEVVYMALISKANNQQCTLKTGRKKTPQSVPAKEILNFIIGKSVKKNE